MPLSSPYFRNVAQLSNAALNAPWLSRGATGIGVHLLQFALIELGFPMPGSVGGTGLSPDGIYGGETVDKVREFQRSSHGGPPVKDDGAAGAITMAKLDRAIGSFTHKVNVHLIQTSPPAVPALTSETVAREVFGHYGIKFDIVSSKSMVLSAADATTLSKKATPAADLRKTITDSKIATLNQTDCFVVMIKRFDPDDVFGETSSRTGAAVTILSDDGPESTLAHEVGHVLLTPLSGPDAADHVPHLNNVMTAGTTITPYVFSIEQITEMRGHPRCHRV